MLRFAAIASGVAALVFLGCGGDDAQHNETTATPSTISSGQRGAIERRLVRYFTRNFEVAPWYRDIRRFEVKGGTPVPGFEEIEDATVVVHTSLAAQDRTAAREICAGVFGADAADVGGTVRVLAERGRLVAECRSDL